MDKVEFKLRLEEIEKLIENQKYPDAARLADSIDWNKVKSVPLLIKISELYKMNKRYEDCYEVLMIAYERNPSNKNVVYALCEVYLDLGDLVNAVECSKEYVRLAGKDDIGAYTLKYAIYEMQNVSAEERIQLLEELKKKERLEKWEYELAQLYHRAGYATKCVEECDELILWFGEGPYVTKAMELKMHHEPLTPEQQAKYNRRNDAKFEAAIQAGIPQEPEEDELDFRVKTVDLSNKFNTINLQAELAENVKEYLDATGEIRPVNVPENMPVTENGDEKKVSMKTSAVYHETIPADAKEIFFEDRTADIRYQVPTPENAESFENPEMEAFREEFSKEYVGKESDISYGRLSETAGPGGDMQEIYMEDVADETGGASDIFDPYLAQESDGQISMAVLPEEREIDKQITGQMNIEEVLSNWEEIKKQNSQKMEDDIRKKMLAQTGEIFKKYDDSNEDLLKAIENFEATKKEEKAPVAEDTPIVEDTPEEAVLESEEIVEEDAPIVDSPSEDMAEITEPEAEIAEEIIEEPESVETIEPGEFYGGVTGLIPGSIWKEVEELPAEQPVEQSVIIEENEEQIIPEEEPAEQEVPPQNDTERLEAEVEKALTDEQVQRDFNVDEGDADSEEKTEVTDNTSDIPVTVREMEKETAKIQLSREVKSLFSPFLYSKKMKKQIVAAIENMSLAAYTANIVISSDHEESGRNLATTFVKYMKQTEGNFSGQVAKVKADRLNQIDVADAFSKVTNGAMIIENANTLTSKTLTQILQTLNQEEKGYLVILVDKKSEIKKLMARSPYMKEFFNYSVDIIAMSINMLVEFGERYAFEKGYAIESMGLLAMNKRIDLLQVGMHAATMGEVKEIVDEAIAHAEKNKVGRNLTRKRKNEDGMILLLEKDFER